MNQIANPKGYGAYLTATAGAVGAYALGIALLLSNRAATSTERVFVFILMSLLVAPMLAWILLDKDIPRSVSLDSDGLTVAHLTGSRKILATDLKAFQVNRDPVAVGITLLPDGERFIDLWPFSERVVQQVVAHLGALGVERRPDHYPFAKRA